MHRVRQAGKQTAAFFGRAVSAVVAILYGYGNDYGNNYGNDDSQQ